MAEDRTIKDVEAMLGEHLDVGHSVVLRWVTKYGDDDHHVVGAIRDHLTPEGKPCSSSLFFDVPASASFAADGRPIHTLVSWQPLHLEPSLLCRTCQNHGHIRSGQWQPA